MVELIVCITGLPGSGKSEAARALKELGFHVLNMGDVLRGLAKESGATLDDGSLAGFAKKLRKEMGPAAVAKLCIDRIPSDARLLVVDGLRSMDEFEEFKRVSEAKILAIHASRERRFNFLKLRGREDDPKGWEDFIKRDERELGYGVARAIALADEVVSNNALSLEEFRERVREVVRGWMRG
ncbi:MAG: AAA family ATPase [Thaumarchaeota archaeon]|nr:AAA family ATPase [Nitrososphaerota archaeon]